MIIDPTANANNPVPVPDANQIEEQKNVGQPQNIIGNFGANNLPMIEPNTAMSISLLNYTLDIQDDDTLLNADEVANAPVVSRLDENRPPEPLNLQMIPSLRNNQQIVPATENAIPDNRENMVESNSRLRQPVIYVDQDRQWDHQPDVSM